MPAFAAQPVAPRALRRAAQVAEPSQVGKCDYAPGEFSTVGGKQRGPQWNGLSHGLESAVRGMRPGVFATRPRIVADADTMPEAGARRDLQPARIENLHFTFDVDGAEAILTRRVPGRCERPRYDDMVEFERHHLLPKVMCDERSQVDPGPVDLTGRIGAGTGTGGLLSGD